MAPGVTKKVMIRIIGFGHDDQNRLGASPGSAAGVLYLADLRDHDMCHVPVAWPRPVLLGKQPGPRVAWFT